MTRTTSDRDTHARAGQGVRRGSSPRRWVKRIGIGLLATIVVVVAGGSGYEAIARHQAASNYPPRGRMIDIGGRSIHLDCRGTGSPTVVFEAGIGTSGALDWDLVHDQIATTTRACTYDRAGLMWSDPKSSHQDADAIAEDLHATLAAAGEKAPFVMVGHSLGGPYVTVYTKKYPGQVAGLVLVDPTKVDRDTIAAEAEMLKSSMMTNYRLAADLAWTGADRLIPRAMFTSESKSIPADVVTKTLAYLPTSASAWVDDQDGIPEALKEAGAFRDFGDRPTVVLSAGEPISDKDLKSAKMTRKEFDIDGARKTKLAAEQADWSTRGRLVLVPESRHYIQFDRPDVVIGAVRDVVASVRNPSAPFDTAMTTQ